MFTRGDEIPAERLAERQRHRGKLAEVCQGNDGPVLLLIDQVGDFVYEKTAKKTGGERNHPIALERPALTLRATADQSLAGQCGDTARSLTGRHPSLQNC
jgi:hypothetical protein